MRVAILSPLFESVPPRLYGGTERVVSNLCHGLTQSDIEVELFAAGDSSVEGKLVPVIDQAIRLRKPPFVDPLAYNFKMLSMVAKKADTFDLIHNHHDYWMLPLSEMTHTPVLSTAHGRMDRETRPQHFLDFLVQALSPLVMHNKAGLPNFRGSRPFIMESRSRTLSFTNIRAPT